jgi:CubicO group peptidase (beta-lactamase class C family)
VGLLMARNGRWKDRQFVSEKWIADSTTSYSHAGNDRGYGYLWWTSENDKQFGQKFSGKVFSRRGSFGQYMLVDPADDLVIVHLVQDNPKLPRSVSGKQFNELMKWIRDARCGTDYSATSALGRKGE